MTKKDQAPVKNIKIMIIIIALPYFHCLFISLHLIG